MKHVFKLIAAYLKVNLQQAAAYRADTTFSIVMNLFWLVWELISLQVIFSNTSSLSGWGLGELIALLGVWRLANMFMYSIVWPNTERFNTSIRDGSFDYNLLQPVNSQLLVSISRVVVWRVWEIVLAAILIGVGVSMSRSIATFSNLVSFLVLALSGMAVLYSLWIVLIAFTFWFVKFDNNVTILDALMSAGRFPATVYPPWLRIIVTFVIPIAIATTVPLQGLRGDLAWWQVLVFLGIGVAALFISSRIWRAGIRKYSSASS
ncbi:MAG TPA: ABC-2 family transporter protein [Anaerolineaceae bacterium]|nr:ABC-2 family transporter protein [Anaerolineaceae bacterium]